MSTAKRTPAIMFQGTSSNAGKSVLTAALCRILLQDGYRVAPFKSQNMSLNSFVTRDGGEMGRAQVVQAQACRLDPEVRMNPILLKPSSDVGSQVIVNGRPVANMSVGQYIDYKPEAFRAARQAYGSLAAEFEVIVLEGAGSPAEVNLKHHDIVNMAMARHAGASVILVGDIDRGGVFASFVGTMEILEPWERELVAGYLINCFRGQKELLAEALTYMQAKTGKSVLGVIDYLPDLGLPQEDSVSFKSGLFERPAPSGDYVTIGLIDLPHISNFTDLEPFLAEPDVHLTTIKRPEQLAGVAALILPGSKNVITDMAWLSASGLAAEISRLALEGETTIVGLCGGYQMLGRLIEDPHHLESAGKTVEGLGLLGIRTVLEPEKTLTRQQGTHLPSGLPVHGYEIHHGQSQFAGAMPLLTFADGAIGGLANGTGNIWGTYLHGVFDADAFRRWFIDRLREKGALLPLRTVQAPYDLEPALERLAATVRQQLDMPAIYRLLEK